MTSTCADDAAGNSPHKVYVALGFHANFYHSWRGDSPDEGGFGTDIRMVREILGMLDAANRQGLDARGYWDWDIYWTLEQIIPAHAPDIIENVRRRVMAGLDEVLPMSYNNGANHAATEDELRTALAYSMENPYGSGLKQLFGQAAPLCRPQEGMYTAGHNRILREEGYQGLINYYSTIPFTAISAFIPALPPEIRYNPFWFRCVPDEEPIAFLPCVSPPDVINYISLERWLLDLRKLQVRGQVDCDLLIHINFDADVETWLPMGIPKALQWFPNTGGLPEYIKAVNKYDWAAFCLPSEYLRTHPPQAEVLVLQDLADGAFDGNYSWAEKFASLTTWSTLERSRLHSYRAMALCRKAPALADAIRARLWEGRDSSFFHRLVALTTTHFGMSTPVINEERQAKAIALTATACDIAARAEADAARAIRSPAAAPSAALYKFQVYNYGRGRDRPPKAVRAIIRVPLILPAEVAAVSVRDGAGQVVAASLVNLTAVGGGHTAGELLLTDSFDPDEHKSYEVYVADTGNRSAAGAVRALQNDWLKLALTETTGIASLEFTGQMVGEAGFLRPFITYRSARRPQTWYPCGYEIASLAGEQWQGLTRARLTGAIPMETPDGQYTSELDYTFTLFDSLPYLLVDVQVRYAYSPPHDIIHTMQQKLRRLLDLRWIEVAPFQLSPSITARVQQPLHIWKHNYLGITSHYELNYGQINPKNCNLDSFSHQVTAGWVGMSNGTLGLLLAESAEALAGMAFCPMRLRENVGVQQLSLNPFGSYFGRQLDHSHLGGTGVGTAFAQAISGALKPSGPSFNGQLQRFSLLLVPYGGDQPPQQLQHDAEAFFYPCGTVYLKTPKGVDAATPTEMRALIARLERVEHMKDTAPLAPPTAALANPSDGAADLVWDKSRDQRATGYQARWRPSEDEGWQTADAAGGDRLHIPNLTNGLRYTFQVRALAPGLESAWTAETTCVPGPTREKQSLLAVATGASPIAMLKMVYYGILHGLTTARRRIR